MPQIALNTNPAIYARLDQLASDLGCDRAKAIACSLALMEKAVEHHKQGKKIAVVDENHIVEAIVRMPWEV